MYFNTGSEKSPRKIDLLLIISTIVLVIFGMLMVYSATIYRHELYGISKVRSLFKEVIRIAVGIGAFFIASRLDPKLYKKQIKLLMYLNTALLALLFLIGLRNYGAIRWIRFGIMNFQPSELAKLITVLYIASELSQEKSALKNPAKLLKILVMPFLNIILIALQPNLSSAIILGLIIIAILFFAGVKLVFLFVPAVTSIILPAFLLLAFPRNFRHVQKRLETFVSGKKHYQVKQALIAVAQGGPFGKGIGKGTQKYLYLPMAENDFIFAIIAEELGLTGVVLIILGYIFIISRGIRVASRHFEGNFYYSLLAAGITFMIFFPSAIHIGVNLGLIPPTGQILPLISLGGSSLLVTLFGIGTLEYISEKVEEYERI
uniref:Probable peptidoglycan glycosyltransferase FtsW n=1 Tax=candidate division WOR-3 bacterium TaxID=2052148 RepID=A0A7C2PDF0_UNCW3